MEIALLLVLTVAAGLSLLACLILLLWLRKVSQRQDGIVEELRQVSAAQRRIVERFHELDQRHKAINEKLRESPHKSESAKEPAVTPHATEAKANKADIIFLARQGLGAETIARQLNVPRGEVELILDLDRFGNKG